MSLRLPDSAQVRNLLKMGCKDRVARLRRSVSSVQLLNLVEMPDINSIHTCIPTETEMKSVVLPNKIFAFGVDLLTHKQQCPFETSSKLSSVGVNFENMVF